MALLVLVKTTDSIMRISYNSLQSYRSAVNLLTKSKGSVVLLALRSYDRVSHRTVLLTLQTVSART